MRKYAILKEEIENIKKIMVYESTDGIYIFLYNSVEDVSGIADEWYEDIESAYKVIKSKYKVKIEDMIEIDDPYEFCQDDIILPVRIKGRNVGKPEFGKFEKLVDGIWVEIKE